MPRLTITEIAGRVGVNKSTVSRQAARFNLKGDDGLVDLDQYLAIRATGLDPLLQPEGRSSATPADAGDSADLAAERARKMRADADRAELDLARTRGELLDKARAERAYEDAARRLRDAVMQVPRDIAADLSRLGDELAIEAHLTQRLSAAFSAVHAEMAGDAA